MSAFMLEQVIEIRNLRFSFNGNLVLKDVSFNVKQGDFLALIGPNGGGKTTMLKLMLGFLEPDQGMVRVFGRPPRKVSRHIGYIPQYIHMNSSFPISVMDVVLMGRLRSGRFWSGHTREDRIKAGKALEKLEMSEYHDQRIGELSGGQRQRVFIARAIVTEPEILVLDEPTASIDTRGQTDFYEILKDLNKTTTILLVSHDLMVISRHVKSVACVNQSVFYHDDAEFTDDMLNMYNCPVELVAHGLPHRVLKQHTDF